MRIKRTGTVDPGHPDYVVIKHVEAEVLKRAGGIERLRAEFPQLIRRAIDEVIDTPRTKRLLMNQLEKTEKTYIGTKIEILLRDFLGLPKGILDLVVDGVDVDIKNTISSNWMIPDEAVGKPCILVMSDEKLALCQLGIIFARIENLNPGFNKDNKRSISTSTGFLNINWILLNTPYPKNFWEDIDPKIAKWIMQGGSGNERLIRLFETLPKRPIHRNIIQGVARQQDYMKRLRRNGGARDTLSRNGIALLSGKYDSPTISRLGLVRIDNDEFISYKPENEEEEEYLKHLGYID